MRPIPHKTGLTILFTMILWMVFTGGLPYSHAGDIEAGKQSTYTRMCRICHIFEGDEGKVGPRLSQVGIRRSREWLVRWLDDPKAIIPDTVMPRVPWEAEELENVVDYLLSLKVEIRKEEALALPDPQAGAKLVEMYDCRGCHKILEGGRRRFPDLTLEATIRDAEWLDNWLTDPQAVKPGTFMPTFPFSEAERLAIIKFLLTLK